MKSLLSSLLVVAGSSLFGPNLLHAAPMNAQVNVLMIAIDDLNDYISVPQDHPGIKTPNFDRLAARGINFTRAYCAAPLCNPSRVNGLAGVSALKSIRRGFTLSSSPVHSNPLAQ